jgi:pimeloyl-ACP methyl ester carboxylesterase
MSLVPPVLPSSKYVECGGHQVHYLEWGDRQGPVIVMWHGLARNCRDFDDLARRLADKHRIICPDTIGRGLSEWSASPGQDYNFSSYAKCAAELFNVLEIEEADWVGTSMGGALGIFVAGGPLRGRITRLVLNDIGPILPEGPFERIKQYVGNPPSFSRLTEFEEYLRTVYRPFGWHSDAQWIRMAEMLSRRLPDGRFTSHYDPRIVLQMFDHPHDFEQWDTYKSIALSTLVLRGESSDVLSAETAQWMSRNGSNTQVIDIPNCGHAPGLNTLEQIEVVAGFLEKGGR